MTARILLLGASGRLGRAVVAAEPGVLVPPRASADLALCSETDWERLLRDSAAEVVLNAAALADVDRCEREPDLARAVNAEGPGRLAAACATLDLPLLHVSTDYVFGDVARRGPGPYSERARRAPVQTYGASKAEGEARVLAAGWRVSVARVSWLFGPDGSAFTRYVLDRARRGADGIPVFSGQRSRPTWLPDLAAWLTAACRAMVEDRVAAGPAVPPVLHPAGGPGASRESWARVLLDAAGFPGVRTVEQRPEPGVAVRPADSLLDGAATARWAAERGLPPIRDWREVSTFPGPPAR